MRRLLALGFIAVLSACGDSTSPPPFPAVAGTYRMDITFSDFPPSVVNASGTITITQASRNAPDLTGSASVIVTIGGDNVAVTQLTNASVTEAGVIRFRLTPPNSSSTWGFDGTVTASGMSGTHVLVGSTSSFPGTFTATRQ
ncbi:MAG: hypothetical protein K0S86_5411 [Geminicoccaceae bacterium]|nr:hypothetical protein [Geminicoccaceae bacterium]